MSMKSVGLATMGATTGLIAGNYLYNLDKEANKYKEVPVPFYTVRKAADDIGKETKKMVDNIKAKCQGKKDQEEVHQMTDEEVVEELKNAEIHEVVNEEVVEELKNSEQPVIDAKVVDGKAVEVDAEGNPVVTTTEDHQEQQISEAKVQPQETKVVGNTEETSIPQFTVVDQVPVNNKEEPKEEDKPAEKATTKATTKGSSSKTKAAK